MAKAVQLHDAPRVKRTYPENLKFICRTERVQYRHGAKWKSKWVCYCGTEFEAFHENVMRRHTTSCGCEWDRARRRAFPIHGHSGGKNPRSPTYKSWQAMIARCTNSKHPAFEHYGGRGIKIHAPWIESFAAFLADVGERPIGRSLDRVNPDGNYEPSNCRWATALEQRHNRRQGVKQ